MSSDDIVTVDHLKSKLQQVEKELEISRKELELIEIRNSINLREKEIPNKSPEKQKQQSPVKTIEKKKPPIMKNNVFEILDSFFATNFIAIQGARLKTSDVSDKINNFLLPLNIRFSKFDIANFFQNKNIERKKIGSNVYYLNIDYKSNQLNHQQIDVINGELKKIAALITK